MHDLTEIRARARFLMSHLGERLVGRSLLDLGWTFRFDRARRRLGICRWEQRGRRVRVISLSRFYAEEGGWAIMEDVVKHEIAHAIDYERRGASDHGRVWKAIARQVGADPTRLYEGPDVPDHDSKYVGICSVCMREHPFYRRVKRKHACPDCCRAHNRGRFSNRFLLRIFERESGIDVTPRVSTWRQGRRAT